LQQKMVDKLLKVDHQKDDESDLEQTEMWRLAIWPWVSFVVNNN
jgi:hypothetical protein